LAELVWRYYISSVPHVAWPASFLSNTRLSECLCILEGAAKRRKNCTNCSSATRERQRNKTKDLKKQGQKEEKKKKTIHGLTFVNPTARDLGRVRRSSMER
jgi:hypothetical protein